MLKNVEQKNEVEGCKPRQTVVDVADDGDIRIPLQLTLHLVVEFDSGRFRVGIDRLEPAQGASTAGADVENSGSASW
jgi:hypothetical protein